MGSHHVGLILSGDGAIESVGVITGMLVTDVSGCSLQVLHPSPYYSLLES